MPPVTPPKPMNSCDGYRGEEKCMSDPLCTWCGTDSHSNMRPECVLLTDVDWIPSKYYTCASKLGAEASVGINCAKFQSNDDCNSDSECSWCVKSSVAGKKKKCVKGGEAISAYIPLGFKCNNLD